MSSLTDNKVMETMVSIRQYKTAHGNNYPAVLSIPQAARLPALAVQNYEATLTCVSNAIMMFLEAEGITAGQSVAIADAIITSSVEDQLSIQDLLLFLQGARAGQYGKFYGSATPMQFMELMENYRQERHEALTRLRDETHSQYKAQGREIYLPPADTPGERLTDDQLKGMVNQIKNTYGEQE